MGLNDQADADTRDTGHDEDANLSAGQDDDSTQGGDDQNKDVGPSFDDVNDIESYSKLADQMAEAEMPGDEASKDEADADGERSDETDGDGGEQLDGDDNKDDQAQADDADDQSGDQKDDADDNREDANDDANKSNSKRFRVRNGNPVDLRALELVSRNQDMSLKDAMAKAEAELGGGDISDTGDGGGDGDGQGEGLPESIEDTETEIARLRAEKSRVMREELDFDRVEELEEEIRKLDRHTGDLRLAEIQNQGKSEQAYLQGLEQSKSNAVELYDFVTNEGGKEIERMEEIDQQLKDNGDPLYDSADKPLRIAQMVAREFGIAPKGKVVKKPENAKPGIPPKKKSPVQPASASARTAPTDQQGQYDKRLDEVNDPIAWDELMEEYQ